jgi:DNA primase
MKAETIKQSIDYSAYYRAELPNLTNGSGDNASAHCPFHEDQKPSLSVNLKTGLFKCHCPDCRASGDVFRFHQKKHGCTFPEAVKELGKFAGFDTANGKKARKSLGKVVAAYDYLDADGKVIFQTVRFDPKDFRQRRPDGNGGWINEVKSLPELVPYNLPEVLKAETVDICEGEKDCLALARLGMTATCNPMGAEKWRKEYNRHFQGKRVVILPDNDQPGLDHAQDIARNLQGVAASVKVVELPDLPEKGDFSIGCKPGERLSNFCSLPRLHLSFPYFPKSYPQPI